MTPFLQRLVLLLAACAGLLFLAACHQVQPEKILIVSVSPPVLDSGQWVTITAAPKDLVELAYVSGTVAIGGAPVVPFKYDGNLKTWLYRRFIPSFVSIPRGQYTIKAWGETAHGERYQGSASVEAK